MPTAPLRPCAEPRCPQLVTAGRCPAHARTLERQRPNRDVRKWYFTARWQRLRQQVLVDAVQQCAVCRHVEAILDVDHIRPHQGDPGCFWDRANLQALCHGCHTRKTNRGE